MKMFATIITFKNIDQIMHSLYMSLQIDLNCKCFLTIFTFVLFQLEVLNEATARLLVDTFPLRRRPPPSREWQQI